MSSGVSSFWVVEVLPKRNLQLDVDVELLKELVYGMNVSSRAGGEQVVPTKLRRGKAVRPHCVHSLVVCTMLFQEPCDDRSIVT